MNKYTVKCDQCGTLNKLTPYDIAKHKPKCGSCGIEISNEKTAFLSIKLEDHLPTNIALAARNYYFNEYIYDDLEKEKNDLHTPKIGPAWRLIESFGEVSLESKTFYRLLWLCYNLIKEVEFLWFSMTDNHQPVIDFMTNLLNYLNGNIDQKSLLKHCSEFKPIRNGSIVSDCDSCALDSIASACAITSKYIVEYNPEYIENVIYDTGNATDERAFTNSAEAFDGWIASHAIIYSYKMKSIPTDKHLLWMPDDSRNYILNKERAKV